MISRKQARQLEEEEAERLRVAKLEERARMDAAVAAARLAKEQAAAAALVPRACVCACVCVWGGVAKGVGDAKGQLRATKNCEYFKYLCVLLIETCKTQFSIEYHSNCQTCLH